MHSGSDRRTPYGGLDLLRHLFILAVIFQHMLSPTRYSIELNAFIATTSTYIDGAVAGFFLISGFFSKKLALTRWSEVTSLGIRFANRLLVPYLLFSVIYGVLLVSLGKMTLVDAIERTVTFAGVGPQLYFLPYLFLISVSVAVYEAITSRTSNFQFLALAGACAVIGTWSFLVPIKISTGPEPLLLPFYAAAYLLGVVTARSRNPIFPGLLGISAAAVLVFAEPASRAFDSALVVLLFSASLFASRMKLLQRRFPGSGGVYLLHAPIVNHALSTVLVTLGIIGMANLFAAIIATYIITLLATLMVIRFSPRLRGLLLE